MVDTDRRSPTSTGPPVGTTHVLLPITGGGRPNHTTQRPDLSGRNHMTHEPHDETPARFKNGYALPDLDGRVAVITGGASGIGKAIAQRFAAAGMRVVISDLDGAALAAAAAELGVDSFAADVTDPEQVQRLADDVVARHGKIDVAVNNAGVGPTARIRDLTLDDWRWMIDVNLFGVIHGICSFLPVLTSNPHGGYIVNTASMAGLTAIPGVDMAAYTAAKMGVVGITEILAAELAADGASVGASVLCPGPVLSHINSGLRSRPADQQGALTETDPLTEAEGPLADLEWKDPLEAGTLVIDGIRSGRLHLITHPELWWAVGDRFAAIERAFDITAR